MSPGPACTGFVLCTVHRSLRHLCRNQPELALFDTAIRWRLEIEESSRDAEEGRLVERSFVYAGGLFDCL